MELVIKNLGAHRAMMANWKKEVAERQRLSGTARRRLNTCPRRLTEVEKLTTTRCQVCGRPMNRHS